MSRGPVIAYLFTTFPKVSETFLLREVRAMRDLGVDLRLYSLWGGGGEFDGIPVRRFPKAGLATLLWHIPRLGWRHGALLRRLLRGLATRRAPSWLNFWENMLGAGFAAVHERRFAEDPPDWVHAVWGGGPATAAWLLGQFHGRGFSTGAHAYDLYEHGGDWWLREKLADAAFVHTSTAMGRETLIARGVPAERIRLIRRGLERFPPMRPLREDRRPLRLLCVARLVAKKGLDRQLGIHAALGRAGVAFEARIVGEGPLRAQLEAQAAAAGLAGRVSFLGQRPQSEVQEHLAWADVLLHTGVVAPSGDRDGLPNVIPEAMAAGVVVVTSPAAATTEAVHEGRTGYVIPVERPEAWVSRLRQVAESDEGLGEIRAAARAWVEAEFDARRNAGRLLAAMREAMAGEGTRA